ncbi:MAG TPA: efflux RND transporter permease subunit [Candidatus Binataceae bacterium]
MPSFALRNPFTVIVGALIIAILGVTAFSRMPVDVFPNLKIPAVVVATFYPGMPPLDMERDITTRYERFFTLGSGIEHIESRSLPGVSIITVYLHGGIDVDAAAAQLATLAMADLGVLPPGTLPPLVLKFDASSLPVTLVTVEGKGFSQVQLEDQARYNIRNQLATVQGASVPMPFGGKIRQIMAYVDRQALQARGMTLNSVVDSVNHTNLILPAGDAKIGSTDYYIYSNAMIDRPEDLNDFPIKVTDGQIPVRLGDVGKVEDSTAIQYNIVTINGQPSVYVPVLKQGGANTIAVVNGIQDILPRIIGMPSGLKLKAIFNQSDYILDAVHSLEEEAVTGSVLASLMILIFLGSFRSTFAIFLSIPLSILAATFGLYLNDSTINIMTLGGFALAIGRLVDDSIVVLENINRHLAEGKAPAVAAREGAEEVALPVLASTITTIIVFVPVMFLFGVAKYLFSALALSVVLAMMGSYVVAMSVIPIYCARFLTSEAAMAHAQSGAASSGDGAEHRGGIFTRAFGAFNRGYERFAERYEKILVRVLDNKIFLIGGVSLLFVISMAIYPLLGTQLFPTTDAGKFIIHMRSPAGTRIEVTHQLAARVERLIREVIPPAEIDTVVSNLGLAPSISAIYSSNSGEDTGEIMVTLAHDHAVSTFHYMNILKRELPTRVPEVTAFFSSGSIIDAVLNFGLPAPIDIQVSGPDYGPLFAVAHEIQRDSSGLREVSQTFIPQEADYPTLDVEVDRVRAARMGLTEKDVVTNVITALTSNQMIAPSIWIDRTTGNDYFLTTQYREQSIDSIDTLNDIPVHHIADAQGHEQSILLRNVATIVPRKFPSEADHYNIQRVVDVLVDPATSDLGGTQTSIEQRLKKIDLPHDVTITYRGAVAAMQKSFSSFGLGLGMAVVLLYLVMVAQFASFLDPFIIMFAVPMGLIGVIWTLWLTNTTLNIESFMGIIVMVGIVVSNSILLVDFANQRRREGQELRRAVVESARIRMRPILMTALATIAGLIPIALTLGTGSEASAPLARAAVGGLLVSTILTLVLVPSIYELFYSWRASH